MKNAAPLIEASTETGNKPPAIYVWLVPSEHMLDQPGSWRIRKWDTAPFPEATHKLSAGDSYVDSRQEPSEGALLAAIARGWCTPENERKEVDCTLGLAIAAEVRKLYAASPVVPHGFAPIDGNWQNTALENWFPISAEELERLRAEVARLRSRKCQYAQDVGMPEYSCASSDASQDGQPK